MERTQVILITGASSGFGKVTAQALAGKGYVVYGTSRRIANGNIGQIRMLIADVTDENSVRSAVNRIMDEQGHIDVLINNAGMGIGGALEMATDEEISSQMDTNFMGMVRMCRAVLPIMRKQRQGKIINISSIAGRIAVPYQGFYSASKFAIEGYSEALSMEVYPFGIKVCVVEPGDFKDASSICTIQRMDTGQSHSICITLFLRDKIKRLHRNNTILQKEMIFCLASTGEKAIFVAVIIK